MNIIPLALTLVVLILFPIHLTNADIQQNKSD